MYYKKYGKTDIKVSAVGMGCMRFDEEDVKENRFEKCSDIVLYAHEKGINYFDTAPFYCDDKSETITGMALSQLPRGSYYVTSKTNRGTLDNDCSAESFRRRLELSLERLRVDYIDFYHLWCVLDKESFESQCEELYKFFEQAKAEGLIRHIVFSSHMQGEGIQEAVDTGRFEGILLGYNALNYRFRRSGIEAAHKKGMGVVVMNPLGGGTIPGNPGLFQYLKDEQVENVAQGGLRFVASQKEVTVTLAGCTTRAHVDDACKAVEGLEEDTAKNVCQRYEGTAMALNDLCTGCGYCDHCPKGIAIPKYMDAYNQKLFGKDIKGRLKGHWGTTPEPAGTCISCGKCEKLCTQHLPIIERLNEIAAL